MLRFFVVSLFLITALDCRDQEFIEGSVAIVIRLPVPIPPGGGIIHLFGPGIYDLLAAGINFKVDLGRREGFYHDVVDVLSGKGEGGHVVDDL